MATRRNKKQKDADEKLVDLVEVRDQAQGFLDKYQNYVFGALTAVVLIIGGFFAYNNFILKPKQLNAIDQMSQAQLQFARDSFSMALTNPGGGYKGFLDIAKDFRGTRAGNLANYYAGICYLHLGEYAAALDYLNDYKPHGEITPIMKYGAMGDAFSELNDLGKAMKYYKMAIAKDDNEFLVAYYLKKIAMLNEHQGNFAEAAKTYERIKTEFPNTPAGRDIDKYIMRASMKNK